MLVSLSLGAQAQTQPQDTTMNRTVVVEQEYNPDIMDASKVNVLPQSGRTDSQQEKCGIRHDILSGDLRSSRSRCAPIPGKEHNRQHSRICACRLWQLRQSRCTRQLIYSACLIKTN